MFFSHAFSETRVTREHDTAMNKLFDWLASFESQLDETLTSVKEFHSKDRMSEAKNYVAQLDELRQKVEGFLEEVFFDYLEARLLADLNNAITDLGD